MKTFKLFFLSILTLSLSAQNHGNLENSEKLAELAQLVGHWKGEGYILDQTTREKKTFIQTEEISYDLDSTILYVKGIGTSDDKIVHDARAIISPADSAHQFDFHTFLADGRKGHFLMQKEGNKILWFIETPQGTIRYTITLNGMDYHEIGEFGKGESWYPFMEMNLKKIKS